MREEPDEKVVLELCSVAAGVASAMWRLGCDAGAWNAAQYTSDY